MAKMECRSSGVLEKEQKNSHAIPQFLKEVNLVGLVEKYCVAIAKFCLPTL
jgi:hypothetical protein